MSKFQILQVISMEPVIIYFNFLHSTILYILSVCASQQDNYALFLKSQSLKNRLSPDKILLFSFRDRSDQTVSMWPSRICWHSPEKIFQIKTFWSLPPEASLFWFSIKITAQVFPKCPFKVIKVSQSLYSFQTRMVLS